MKTKTEQSQLGTKAKSFVESEIFETNCTQLLISRKLKVAFMLFYVVT